MKRLFKYVGLVLVLSLVALADQSTSVVGSWVSEAQHAQWTFRPDGTGMMQVDQPKTTARFNWQLQGTVLHITTAGTAVPYLVLQCDQQKMVLKNERISQSYQFQRT